MQDLRSSLNESRTRRQIHKIADLRRYSNCEVKKEVHLVRFFASQHGVGAKISTGAMPWTFVSRPPMPYAFAFAVDFASTPSPAFARRFEPYQARWWHRKSARLLVQHTRCQNCYLATALSKLAAGKRFPIAANICTQSGQLRLRPSAATATRDSPACHRPSLPFTSEFIHFKILKARSPKERG